jgi:tape measure domain-containing protein
MATANRRDVRLAIGVETTNAEALQKLAQDIRRVGTESGTAAAQFDQLADQADRLTAQAQQAQSVRALAEEINRLGQEQQEVAAAAARATEALQQQQTTVAAARERQSELREEITRGRVAQRDAIAEVRQYREASDAATRKTREYEESISLLRAKVDQAREAVDRKRDALAQQGTAVSQAVNEERKLQAVAERAAAALEASQRAIRSREVALRESEAALTAAGAATTDLAQAEAQLAQEQQELIGQFERLQTAQNEARLALRLQQEEANRAAQEYAQLQGSLRATQEALSAYAAASVQATAAAGDDTQAVQRRVAAAQALVDSDRNLTQQQRDLANALDVSRAALISNAQALVRNAADAEASRAATARLVREAQSAGAALRTAFGTTGVRSLDAIEQEALAVERAVSLLERQFRAGAISAQDLARATAAAQVRLQQLRSEASQVQSLPGAFERVNDSINGLITRFGTLTAAIGTVSIAARPAVEALLALEQARRVLTTVSGSVDEANRQIEFLRSTAQRAGVSFDSLAGSYSKFAASALQTGLPLADIQSTFEAVAVASGNLGLSSDQAQRALEALGQIASKGVANMEELRQQLGDALPGVLPLLAKQLGLTNAELFKIVESGQLTAREAIPAVRDALRQLGTDGTNDVEGLRAEWNRFKSALSETATLLGEGPLGTAIGLAATGLSKVVGAASVGVVGISEFFQTIIRGSAGAVAALTGGQGLSGAFENLAQEYNAAELRIVSLAARFGLLDRKLVEQYIQVRQLSGATGQAGQSFAKLAVDQTNAQQAVESATRAVEKQAQAARTAVAAAETLSRAAVDQAAGQRGVLSAQLDYVAALDRQVASEERQADIYRRSRAELLEKIRAEGLQIDQFRTQIDAIDKKIVATESETQKTREAARAERAKIVELELAARQYEDNSREVAQLQEELEAAERAYDSMARRFARGKATTDDVRDATNELAQAKRRLKDATDDVSKAFDRQIRLAESEYKIAEARLEIEEQLLRTQIAKARQEGDEQQVRRLSAQLLELEQRQLRTKNDLTVRQIQLQLEQLRAEEDSLRRQGVFTAEKEEELRVRRNLLIAQTLQSRAAEEEAKQKGAEAAATLRATDAKRANTGAANENSDSMRRVADGNRDATGASRDFSRQTLETTGRIKTFAETLLEYSDAALKASAADRIRREEANAALGPANLGGAGLDPDAFKITGVRTPGSMGNNPTPGSLSVLGPSKLGLPDFNASAAFTPPDNSGNWEFDVEEFNRAGGVNAGFDNNAAQKFWRRKGGGGIGVGVSRSGRGAAASNDAELLRTQLAVAQQAAIAARQPQGGTTVTVNLNLGGKSARVPTTQEGADSLLALLEEAQRASGGGP